VIVKDHFDNAEFKIILKVIKTRKNKRKKIKSINLAEI